MKRNNKKGFTIVELVIVIAVIAILAGVLIPTFAGVVNKANESRALQEAKNAYTADLALLDGQATNYMNFKYKEAAYTAVAADVTTPVSGETYFTKEDYKSLTINNADEFATAKGKYTTLYTDSATNTPADTFVANTTTYYVKEDVYTAVSPAPTTLTTSHYYRKSICAGTFSGENYTTYTITVDDEYVCTYDGDEWSVEKKSN